MAKSENQGVQIALIVFVILTLILSVTTFMLFNSHRQAVERVAALDADNQRLEAAVRDAVDERRELAEAIGFDASTPLGDVRQVIARDRAHFRSEKPTYRDALAVRDAVIADRDATIVEQRRELADLGAEYGGVQDLKTTEIKVHRDAAEAASADKLKVIEDYYFKDQRMVENHNEIRSTYDKKQLAWQDRLDKAENKIRDQKTVIEDQFTDIRALKKLVDEGLPETFNKPDGEIVRVDPAARAVWINLGSSDRLQRRTMFSVYDRNNHQVDSPKATIEVTEIALGHLARARIVHDNAKDPILRGDPLFSLAFNPGKQVRFALAGVFDLDADGVDDRELVRNFIRQSGGVVDAEVDGVGKRTGKLTVYTRFLVRGATPMASAENKDVKAGVDGLFAMRKEAEDLGIELLGMERFLELIGGHRPVSPLRFGEPSPVRAVRDPLPDGGRRFNDSTIREDRGRRTSASRAAGAL